MNETQKTTPRLLNIIESVEYAVEMSVVFLLMRGVNLLNCSNPNA